MLALKAEPDTLRQSAGRRSGSRISSRVFLSKQDCSTNCGAGGHCHSCPVLAFYALWAIPQLWQITPFCLWAQLADMYHSEPLNYKHSCCENWEYLNEKEISMLLLFNHARL